jgi:hypothetical protein
MQRSPLEFAASNDLQHWPSANYVESAIPLANVSDGDVALATSSVASPSRIRAESVPTDSLVTSGL